MLENKTLEELLGINNIEVIKSRINEYGELFIYVRTTSNDIYCRKCGTITAKCHGLASEIKLRHLSMCSRQTYIIIQPKRGKCKHCDNNPTSNQKVEWYEYKKRQTKAYENYILLSSINSTIQDVSRKENLGYSEVEGIVKRAINTQIDWDEVKEIGALGIDEISLKKGYKDYLTIISSHVDGKSRVLSIIKGKKKEDIVAFLLTIPKSFHKTIFAICTDMYEGYINAARDVFSRRIPIVIDRFHVAKSYRNCLIKLRISELKRLRKSLSESRYRELKDAIAILVRNPEFITLEEKKILKPLFKLSPDLKRAYKLCCRLTAIFNSHVPKRSASKKINHWIKEAESSELSEFKRFSGTLHYHKKDIINYFNGRQNSGFVEGINNKIKVMKRRCYGISNPKTVFQRLFLDFFGYQFLGLNCA